MPGEGGPSGRGPVAARAGRSGDRRGNRRSGGLKTLVTGAAGFLGSHLTRQLVARGGEVRVLLRPSSSNRAIADLPLEYITGDLRDPASLDRALAGVERVFHVAADYRLWSKRSE